MGKNIYIQLASTGAERAILWCLSLEWVNELPVLFVEYRKTEGLNELPVLFVEERKTQRVLMNCVL